MTIKFDTDVLERFFHDIGPASKGLLEHYVVDIRGKIDSLSGIREESDITNLAIHAHSLKGLSRTCGLVGIGDEALELEKACREGNQELAFSHHAKISDNIETAIDTLNAFIAEHAPTQDS